MPAELVRKWTALALSAAVLGLSCGTVGTERDMPGEYRLSGAQVPAVRPVAWASPAELTARTVSSGAMRVDAFEYLLTLAGLDDVNARPPRDAPLTPPRAARVLTALSRRPVTLGAFPPRMAVNHLLREVLEGGEVSREELLRRVARFDAVAVLRPDGYLAWARTGRTQQKVGPVEWKEGAFRAGAFELGRFYTSTGLVFRRTDAHLSPILEGPPVAEVYDDADYLGRTLDGAEASFVELYHATGQFLTRPSDGLAALRHLPAGVTALLASSPEYLERFRYMTRGEQVKALAQLTTHLLVTFGTAGGTTSTLTRAFAGAEATVPVLSLSAEGALVMERIAVPVGEVATVLGGGPGAAIILQRASASGQSPAPIPGPGQWGPAEEAMSDRARAYQEQISGHTADEAYWVGGTSTKTGGVKFDGFKDGVLLEAKGPGYANKFLDNLEPKAWFKNSGARNLVKQAKRQFNAAANVPIRWHIAEKKTAEAIQVLFERETVKGIEVVYTPPL